MTLVPASHYLAAYRKMESVGAKALQLRPSPNRFTKVAPLFVPEESVAASKPPKVSRSIVCLDPVYCLPSKKGLGLFPLRVPGRLLKDVTALFGPETWGLEISVVITKADTASDPEYLVHSSKRNSKSIMPSLA
jgi:hypothetical protein